MSYGNEAQTHSAGRNHQAGLMKFEGGLKMKRTLEATLLGLILIAIVALTTYPYLRKENLSRDPDVSQRVNDKGYSADIKELRVRFNQDKGKVRLLLLLSPT